MHEFSTEPIFLCINILDTPAGKNNWTRTFKEINNSSPCLRCRPIKPTSIMKSFLKILAASGKLIWLKHG